ncbi:uncharacterized protein LOC123509294 [Portunus trituberculatus]|uniref:uncharacterized protein LOC123509294 n=1 Tax=Portunus trituberculatus TaxID=210409 RepID=UPI001E1CC57F|nr:uncharacterized protein LOC123509294 [Portunus trituberculatus]
MMDPDTQLVPGQHLTVASTFDVDKNYVELKYYICPAEIPTELTDHWTFDCRKRLPLAIIQDMHSATLDVKMMYYFNVTLTTIRIPRHVSCRRCGLMVLATIMRHPTCKLFVSMRSCAFISVNSSFQSALQDPLYNTLPLQDLQ